jgi:hypothetical protein
MYVNTCRGWIILRHNSIFIQTLIPLKVLSSARDIAHATSFESCLSGQVTVVNS